MGGEGNKWETPPIIGYGDIWGGGGDKWGPPLIGYQGFLGGVFGYEAMGGDGRGGQNGENPPPSFIVGWEMGGGGDTGMSPMLGGAERGRRGGGNIPGTPP